MSSPKSKWHTMQQLPKRRSVWFKVNLRFRYEEQEMAKECVDTRWWEESDLPFITMRQRPYMFQKKTGRSQWKPWRNKKHPRRKRTRMLIAKSAYIGRMDKVGETSKVPLQVSEENGTRMKSWRMIDAPLTTPLHDLWMANSKRIRLTGKVQVKGIEREMLSSLSPLQIIK